jgi:hypothetical protein
MMTFMSNAIRFVLRLSPEMHAKLKALAEREERSLHAQIIYMLRRLLESSE